MIDDEFITTEEGYLFLFNQERQIIGASKNTYLNKKTAENLLTTIDGDLYYTIVFSNSGQEDTINTFLYFNGKHIFKEVFRGSLMLKR